MVKFKCNNFVGYLSLFMLLLSSFQGYGQDQKFSVMVIEKGALETILGKEFKIMFFRANKNIRWGAKDKVELEAHLYKGKEMSLEAVPLSTMKKEIEFSSSLIFTSYYISKDSLTKIYTRSPKETQYFLIFPKVWGKGDYKEEFISYTIKAVDQNYKELEKIIFAGNELDPSPPATAFDSK